MLKSVPFYSSLLGRQLTKTKKAVNGHVLVYGAIETHAMGDMGCIASTKTIANECGVSEGSARNLISDLSKAGWISVTLSAKNKRLKIDPLLEIVSPGNDAVSSVNDSHCHLEMNIDNNIRTIKNTSSDSPEATKIATLLADLISERNPSIKQKLLKDSKKWCVDIERLHRLDGASWENIEGVVRWCQADDFWQNNVMSGKKLREKWVMLLAKSGLEKAKSKHDLTQEEIEAIRKRQEAEVVYA